MQRPLWTLTSPWDTECDIHFASSRKVERVESHLRGRLPDALSSKKAHGLSRVTEGLLPLQMQQVL